jgi:hypothetical protein
MKKKQIKLETPQVQALYFAISCNTSIHKLAWDINSLLGFNLKESGGVHLQDMIFPVVKDDETYPDFSITLIKNKIESQVLLKELLNVDFIMKTQGSGVEVKIKNIIQGLKNNPSIIAVIKVDHLAFKNKELLQNT